MRGMIGLFIAACLVGGCSYVNKKIGLSDDNFLEETFEELIEGETGVDIDLSPGSKE